MIEKLVIEMPLVTACKMNPAIQRYVKKMVTSNVKLEKGVMQITQEVNTVFHNKIPEKLGNPGQFVLDYSILMDMFQISLCDIGSGVNLMPYSVTVRLGMIDFKPTQIQLILADRSMRVP